MSTTTVANDDEMFLRDDATMRAITEIANARRIVLYCGAGVTIDRTGVSWKRLLAELFANSERGAKNRTSDEKKAVELLLSSQSEEEQLASMLVEFFRPPHAKSDWENQLLRPKLKEILYTLNGWSEGLLLRNLVKFAVNASLAGTEVEIVTTNYDAYIEDEFRGLRVDLKKRATPGGKVFYPGLTRQTFTTDLEGAPEAARFKARNTVVLKPKGSGQADSPGTITVTYVHGLVKNEDAPAEGTLVLSERSYAMTRQHTTHLLRQRFGQTGTVLLILGASLTDSPLVDALTTAERPASSERYAILRWPDSLRSPDLKSNSQVDESDRTLPTRALRQALGLRGDHLQIKTLYPSNFSQTAQFVQELDVCLSVDRQGGKGTYSQSKSGFSYADRLWRWWRNWHVLEGLTDQAEFAPSEEGSNLYYREVAATLEVILDRLSTQSVDSAESFRLEVWGRIRPTSDNRTLTLIATSDGPRRKTHVPRKVRIDTNAPNASVQAFQAGKPRITTLAELGVDDSASRWKTFMSVPVLVYVGDTGSALTGTGGLVPVGVVTLATTARMSDEVSPSVLAHSDNNTLERVKDGLIGLGRLLLSAKRPQDINKEP